ncbi:MAG: putative lipid II flippase FtsW [Oligoflexales bacterium]|nr:putative lipid II flippase FtsW [Oligoflexales bacterium]
MKANQNLNYHLYLIATAAVLVSIGLLSLYAASAMKGAELYNNSFYFMEKQLLAIAGGTCLILLFKWVSFKFIEHLALPLLIVSLLLLSLILIPQLYKTVGGAARWINFGFASFQPSELAKLGLIFFLAKNLSREKSDVTKFVRGILPNLLILMAFVVFLMLQPDFGTTVLLISLTFLMIYVSGASHGFILASTIATLSFGIVGIMSAPYRWKRLTSFIDPWNDFKEGGFQIIQSYLGFQNGGAFGAGLGESRQKLFFLPEAHTDFILSVIGEEMGLVGTLLICTLYWNMVRLGFRIASAHTDHFKKLLAFGLTSLIALQSVFNIGVVTGILPTKGIPLPFISSGLSSLLIFFTVIAVLARLGQEVPNIDAGKCKTG